MTKPVYAVADAIRYGCDYLTASKRYLVLDEKHASDDQGWFYIRDDNNEKLSCSWHCDSDLRDCNWRRIEGEEADTAVTLDDCPACGAPSDQWALGANPHKAINADLLAAAQAYVEAYDNATGTIHVIDVMRAAIQKATGGQGT